MQCTAPYKTPTGCSMNCRVEPSIESLLNSSYMMVLGGLGLAAKNAYCAMHSEGKVRTVNIVAASLQFVASASLFAYAFSYSE